MPPDVKTLTAELQAIMRTSVDPHVKTIAEAVLALLSGAYQSKQDTLEAFSQIAELSKRQDVDEQSGGGT